MTPNWTRRRITLSFAIIGAAFGYWAFSDPPGSLPCLAVGGVIGVVTGVVVAGIFRQTTMRRGCRWLIATAIIVLFVLLLVGLAWLVRQV